LHIKYLILNLEKEVDGEMLMMLGSCATMEMLNSYGLRTLKQQLLLRKLVSTARAEHCSSNPGVDTSKETRNGKLTMKAIKDMDETEKHIYYAK